MKTAGLILLGVGVGLLVGLKLRASESFCCGLVADAARDKVRDNFGDTAANAGDLLGVYGLAAPFLQATGLRP